MKKTLKAISEIITAILSKKKDRIIGFQSSLTIKDLIPILKGLFSLSKQYGYSISEYERKFAEFIGVPYAFSYYAGRIAFDAILYALDIKEGDEIILPGYTCVAVPNPIIFRKAIPVYVDIDYSTCNISPKAACKAITKKTKAIIIQHTYGIPANIEAFLSISKKYNIPIIEDCCHALGNTYKGKMLGSFGDAAFFSTEQTKIICTGMGGVAITKNSEIAKRLKTYQDNCIFSSHKEIRKMLCYLIFKLIFLNPSTQWFGEILSYYLDRLGIISIPITTKEEMNCRKPKNFRKRFPNALAYVGISQLNQIRWNLKKREKIVNFYKNILPKIGFQILNSFHQQAMVRFPFITEHKYQLRDFAKKLNLDIGVWFCAPVHPDTVPQELAGYSYGSCPNAEKAVNTVANLPCHPNLNESDISKVIKILMKFKQCKKFNTYE